MGQYKQAHARHSQMIAVDIHIAEESLDYPLRPIRLQAKLSPE